jgi:vancomycin resistance protein YoaR
VWSTAQPAAAHPATAQPATAQPGTVQPGTVQPGTVQPGTRPADDRTAPLPVDPFSGSPFGPPSGQPFGPPAGQPFGPPTGPRFGPPAGPPVGPPAGPPAGPLAVGTAEFGDPVSPRRRWRRGRVLLAGGAVAAVLLALGLTGAYAYAGEIPRGTTVLGADLGGLSRAEAAAQLRTVLASRGAQLNAPVAVRVGEKTVDVTPADVGLAVDVEATVDAAASRQAGTLELLFGSVKIDPVIAVDAERLDVALRKAAGDVGPAMVMPAIVFKGTTPKAVHPKPGKGLDAARSAEALRAGWLGGEPVAVPLVDRHPAMTSADVDTMLSDLAVPAVSAPVSVTTDRGALTVPPAAIAKSLLLTADDTGRIKPRVDAKKLRSAIGAPLAAVEVKPREATVAVAGGKPQVVASSGGLQLDTAALAKDLLPVLPKRDGRSVTGRLAPVAPKTTTAEAAKLGIKERVSTFSTEFTGGLSLPRSHNIVQIAKEVDGAVVKPGETFSLNGHTGERGYAQGYKDAPVILDGKLVPGVGGGASQFTTTLFNATYYAGMEDVEHKPHSYWFSRYPSVIESTIFYPDLDFKFRNNTPYGVLLDTSWTSSKITVSVWSTKVYDSVKTTWSAKRNITTPKVVHLEPGPDCIETDGINGFAQDAWRIFRKDGKELRREKFSWKYDPEPRYVCDKKAD